MIRMGVPLDGDTGSAGNGVGREAEGPCQTGLSVGLRA